MKGNSPMKHTQTWIIISILFTFLTACAGSTATETRPLPTPVVYTTRVPSVEGAIRLFLDAYRVLDYSAMYAMLTETSRAAISEQDFIKRHEEAIYAMSVSGMEYAIQSTLTNPSDAQASYRLTYKTALFGDISRDYVVALRLENGQWRLEWHDGLILPELAGGKTLVTYYTIPTRGNIYDRNGKPIAIQTDAYALGLIAGGIPEEDKEALFKRLSQLTGVPVDVFAPKYESYRAGDYVPVGEATVEDTQASGVLAYSGVIATRYTSRYYYPNVAPQAVGHLLYISPEMMSTYRRKGYSGGERVGVQGIEAWAEDLLRGRNAATLYLASAEKTPESILAQVGSQPASSLTLTLDRDLQQQAQAAMNGLPGAIVVMEVNTGRILAMVSSPAPDSNLYDPANYNFMMLGEMLSVPGIEKNRASTGIYPLGSVFKIITMAAALESGLFTPDTVYDCQYEYTEIPGLTLYDWTWERCQQEKIETGNEKCTRANSLPSGELTLKQGLMRSCNPWFYHIGYTLFMNGQTTAIADMARGFGLGQPTGIEQIEEAAGNIPIPGDPVQATSLAIGQGDTLVTPLQVATFIAAIANGGTLYRPQLVEQILPAVGEPIQVFKPEARGSLPIKPETLQAIQQAMRMVAENPRGTAYNRLGTFAIPTAGKTGTAESGNPNPQAWFAGYSLANRPNKPDIAVAVIVEQKGEGSIWALPIFRRVMEIYFFGRPQTLYPWEKNFGVIDPEYGLPATPTPTP
ncbi:MAG: penicillin-binding transpeptidase domain-containing protein [Anaerolineales bacterium]|nr:penicillin-binding transpeptidase domain-containing protein [Anaerolineales bacterium]